MFRDIDSVDWVSKIKLDEMRERDIRSFYSDDISDFNILTETFQSKNAITVDDNSRNRFGEKKFDKIIVKDDVSGLADKSKDFSNILTVSRKFGYICLYIFNIHYQSK